MEGEEDTSTRHTCLKLELTASSEPIFVKGTWHSAHFSLSITDGLNAWVCNGSKEDVEERASQWDQPVKDYIDLSERFLGFQHPGSVYKFVDAPDDHKRLSWTFVREGTTLEWRWKCQPSPDKKKTTAGVLDFLLDANIRLSEEVIRKSQMFEKVKMEAEKCLLQSEKFCKEKEEFESAAYGKFVGVLNSKKAKLRELRDKLSELRTSEKSPKSEEESSDRTEIMEDETDDEKANEESAMNQAATSRSVPKSSTQGQKRIKEDQDIEEEDQENFATTSKDVSVPTSRGRGRKRITRR